MAETFSPRVADKPSPKTEPTPASPPARPMLMIKTPHPTGGAGGAGGADPKPVSDLETRVLEKKDKILPFNMAFVCTVYPDFFPYEVLSIQNISPSKFAEQTYVPEPHSRCTVIVTKLPYDDLFTLMPQSYPKFTADRLNLVLKTFASWWQTITTTPYVHGDISIENTLYTPKGDAILIDMEQSFTTLTLLKMQKHLISNEKLFSLLLI